MESQDLNLKIENNQNPFVAIWIVTYNHGLYIAQAIESVLSQQTNFDFKVFIGDDRSTDSTTQKCQEYKEKHPDIIEFSLHERNIGATENGVFMYRKCFQSGAKYIALCEGDDYWTDPLKLQKQVDFLETHLDYSICSHNVNVSVEDKEGNVLQQEEWLGKKHPETYTIRDLIKYGSGGATCSLVFRSKYIKDILDFFNKSKFGGGDVSLQIMCTQFGNMFYMREVMGVYRRNPRGICSSQSQVTIFDEFGVRKWNSINKYFNGKYQQETDYQLYHYFYPNLANTYYKNRNFFLYNLIRLKRFIIKLQYRF